MNPKGSGYRLLGYVLLISILLGVFSSAPSMAQVAAPLPVLDGEVVTAGDFWITVDKGDRQHPVPYKIAEVALLEGFAHNPATVNMITPTERLYQFKPNDSASLVFCYFVRGSGRPVQALVASAYDNLQTVYAVVGAVESLTLGGQEVYAIAASGHDVFGSVPTGYMQDLFVYIPAALTSTIILDISLHVTGADALHPHADLLAMAEEIVATIRFEPY